jgi:arabinogalactan oligomer/maltooligosaccharide transport system permease protein
MEGSMKLFSILKAIASGIIWGLGQLLNGQIFKFLFFFVVFVLFIGIELGTSHYQDDINS